MSNKVYFTLELFIPDLINGGFDQFAFNSSGTSGRLTSIDTNTVFEAKTIEITRSTDAKEYEFFLIWNDDNVTVPYRNLLTNGRVMSSTYIRYTVTVDGVNRVLFYGLASRFRFDRKGVYVTATSFLNKLVYGNVFATSSNCRWAFGDSFCQFDLSTVNASFTIDTIAADRYSLVTTTTMTANQFRDGFVTFNSSDVRFDISVNTDTVVLFWDEIPDVITSGMTFTITQGCAKTTNACVGYSNIDRFGGIPNGIRYAPSTMRALSGSKDIS